MKTQSYETAYPLEQFHDAIRWNNRTIAITSLEPAGRPQYSGTDYVPIVVAPGLLEASNVLTPFAANLTRAGILQNKHVTATTYDVPMTGKEAYDAEAKAELLAAVTSHVSDRQGSAVAIVGHSQGWDLALRAAPRLLDEGAINTITGVAPAYHCVADNPKLMDLWYTLAHMVVEVVPRMLTPDMVVQRMLAAFTVNAALHIGSDVSAAIEEGRAIMAGDCGIRAAELSHDTRLGMVAAVCLGDAITPCRPTLANFRDTEFAGTVKAFDTDHMGPLVERKWAAEIVGLTYEAQFGLSKPALASVA